MWIVALSMMNVFKCFMIGNLSAWLAFLETIAGDSITVKKQPAVSECADVAFIQDIELGSKGLKTSF